MRHCEICDGYRKDKYVYVKDERTGIISRKNVSHLCSIESVKPGAGKEWHPVHGFVVNSESLAALEEVCFSKNNLGDCQDFRVRT